MPMLALTLQTLRSASKHVTLPTRRVAARCLGLVPTLPFGTLTPSKHSKRAAAAPSICQRFLPCPGLLRSSCHAWPERSRKVFCTVPKLPRGTLKPSKPSAPQRPQASARRLLAVPRLPALAALWPCRVRKVTKGVLYSSEAAAWHPQTLQTLRSASKHVTLPTRRVAARCLVWFRRCRLAPSNPPNAPQRPQASATASCCAQACCAGCTLAAVRGQKGHERCFVRFRSHVDYRGSSHKKGVGGTRALAHSIYIYLFKNSFKIKLLNNINF